MLKQVDTKKDPVGTVRIREGETAVIYVKLAPNRWSIAYVGTDKYIEGHCSDPIAERWPVKWKP